MLVRDPVCRMELDSGTAASVEKYKGSTFYFCSQACQQKSKSDPQKFFTTEEDDN